MKCTIGKNMHSRKVEKAWLIIVSATVLERCLDFLLKNKKK